MRDTPNFDDANFALKLYELRRETELRKARAMIGDLEGKTWEEMEPIFRYDHPENAHLRQATSFWDMIASFVNRGIFHVDTYLDTCGEALFTFWTFRPHLDRIRAAGRPRFLAQTERLVNEHAGARERLESIDKSMAAYAAFEKAASPPPKKPARPGSKRSKSRGGTRSKRA